MKTLIAAVSAAALIAGAAGAANAQHDDHHHGAPQSWGHDQGAGHRWNRGERMGQGDWASAAPVDYHQHHLRRPPHGYEWRESNGQYVLAAVATGVIASIILANH